MFDALTFVVSLPFLTRHQTSSNSRQYVILLGKYSGISFSANALPHHISLLAMLALATFCLVAGRFQRAVLL
jgi:hypothetical protein